MIDFDKLQKRVEAAGGILNYDYDKNRLVWLLDGPIEGIYVDIGAKESLKMFISTYLDGLDAKARARRLVDHLNGLNDTKLNEGATAMIEYCVREICREFGIEEATDERT